MKKKQTYIAHSRSNDQQLSTCHSKINAMITSSVLQRHSRTCNIQHADLTSHLNKCARKKKSGCFFSSILTVYIDHTKIEREGLICNRGFQLDSNQGHGVPLQRRSDLQSVLKHGVLVSHSTGFETSADVFWKKQR